MCHAQPSAIMSHLLAVYGMPRPRKLLAWDIFFVCVCAVPYLLAILESVMEVFE